MATFLLVHGAWHGAWCWERVVAALEAGGDRAVALDLPGHGDDPTPPGEVGLAMYASAVRAAARAAGEPVIAVGHSMGGMVITQAAHDEPELFSLLVYLAAFVPLDGERLTDLGARDRDSLIPGAIERIPDALAIRTEHAAEVFYADCPDEVARDAARRLRPNPARPMIEPVSLPGEIPVPRVYVACDRDRAVSPSFQRELAGRVPMRRVVTMATSHSPFLSAPEDLAHQLRSLAAFAA